MNDSYNYILGFHVCAYGVITYCCGRFGWKLERRRVVLAVHTPHRHFQPNLLCNNIMNFHSVL